MSGDPIYTEMIIEYSRNPSNFGKLENPQITRHDSNPLCGDSIDLYLNIDDKKITDVKFDGKGCAICMACSSVLTEMIKGKNLEDVKKFEPKLALDGGNDGLDLIKKVIYKSKDILKINGLLALEIGNKQSYIVSKILNRNNFRIENKIYDFKNNIRCLISRRNY